MPPDAASTGGRSGGRRTVPHPARGPHRARAVGWATGRSTAEDGQSRASCLARKARDSRAGEEGRRRRCGTGGPRQTRRERGPFRAAVEMQEVWHCADDARQSAHGTAIIASMLRALALSVLIAATPMPALAGAADYDDSGRVAWVTDGDTFRLESGERIRIAGIDAPETHRDQARCAGETLLGLRAKDRATALLAGREVTPRQPQLQPDRRHRRSRRP